MRTSRKPNAGKAHRPAIVVEKKIEAEDLKKPEVVEVAQPVVKDNKKRRKKSSKQDSQLLGGN